MLSAITVKLICERVCLENICLLLTWTAFCGSSTGWARGRLVWTGVAGGGGGGGGAIKCNNEGRTGFI